jgi:hypothetical protein
MNNKSDLYNVQNYTDEQLFQILDLNNPTDRELEAKIHHMIWKYSNFQNDSGKQLMFFFQDIYDHFFDDQEYDDGIMVEGMDNIAPAGASTGAPSGASTGAPAGAPAGASTGAPAGSLVGGASAGALVGGASAGGSTGFNDKSFSYTFPIDYSKDILNPLLKQTIKRIVYINSQDRDEYTSPFSTNFTFNLSSPLKDVVSLKLYSYSIPYTWYTISSSYGSNFFFIKGNAPGINDGNFIFKVKIGYGNYTVDQLIKSVNSEMQNLQYNTLFSDISFGITGLTYNQNTSKATMVLDIKKIFNDSSYELYFSYWTTPNINGIRNTSIPSFLGFNYGFNKYNLYMPYTASMVRSTCNFPFTNGKGYTQDDIDSSIFNLITTGDSSNNWFDVIRYSNSVNVDSYDAFYNSMSNVTDIYKIKFSLVSGTYTRYSLYQDIRAQLANNIYLQNSSLERVDISMNENIIGNGFSQYQLNIELNRFTTKNVLNSKLVVKFPNDTKIWIGNSSAFHFVDSVNDLSTITSETKSVQSNYDISTNPTITFDCINTRYDYKNQYVVNVARGTYLLEDYFTAIKNGFIEANNKSKNLSNPNGVFNFLSSRPSVYIDNDSYFNLEVDITRNFTNYDYDMDITNSPLYSLMDISSNKYSLTPTLIDLSGNAQFRSTFPYSGGGYQVNTNYSDETNSGITKLMTINPKQGINNSNKNATPFVVNIQAQIYSDLNALETAINNAFVNFEDKDGGNKRPLVNCNISLVHPPNGENVNVVLTISVIKSITQKEYSLTLGDTSILDLTNNWTLSTNSWYTFGRFNKPKYDLSNNELVSYSTVTGFEPVYDTSKITINNNNNTIYLVPKRSANGLYTDQQYANSIVLTLPNKTYNRFQLIDALNNLLTTTTTPNGQPIANGSSFDYVYNPKNGFIYTTFRFNINKVFTGADFLLDFYDPYNFTSCLAISRNIQNTTWDSTLGWILGFRDNTQYELNIADIDPETGIVTLTADTTVSVYIYNSFLLVLDDYNQNHMNDGLITTSKKDTDIPLPSYTSRATFLCNNNNNKIISLNEKSTISTGDNTNVEKRLTRSQIYTGQVTYNGILGINDQSNSLKNNQKYSSNGPFAKDVFAIIPLKISGQSQNSPYVDFSGTLQNQERLYFGPVNIHRVTVKLLNDRGEIVDLIGANWSFSLICEQIYQQRKT